MNKQILFLIITCNLSLITSSSDMPLKALKLASKLSKTTTVQNIQVTPAAKQQSSIVSSITSTVNKLLNNTASTMSQQFGTSSAQQAPASDNRQQQQTTIPADQSQIINASTQQTTEANQTETNEQTSEDPIIKALLQQKKHPQQQKEQAAKKTIRDSREILKKAEDILTNTKAEITKAFDLQQEIQKIGNTGQQEIAPLQKKAKTLEQQITSLEEISALQQRTGNVVDLGQPVETFNPQTLAPSEIVQKKQQLESLQKNIKDIKQRIVQEINEVKKNKDALLKKAKTDLLKKNKEAFITTMSNFYEKTINGLRQTLVRKTPYIEIKPELDVQKDFIKNVMNQAAELWLQFELVFDTLPIKLYQATVSPAKWAMLTATAGFNGPEDNPEFFTKYKQHAQKKMSIIKELLNHIRNNTQKLNLEDTKKIITDIYKILFFQKVKTIVSQREDDDDKLYFGIKPEFRQVDQNELRTTLRTLGAIWELMISKNIINASTKITLECPTNNNLEPLTLSATEWLTLTVDAKFDEKDPDDMAFKAAITQGSDESTVFSQAAKNVIDWWKTPGEIDDR